MQKAKEVVNKVTGKDDHSLPTRKLGKNGPEVTAIGYGTMGLVSGESSHSQNKKMVNAS